jgi:hypothetical protein
MLDDIYVGMSDLCRVICRYVGSMSGDINVLTIKGNLESCLITLINLYV